MAGLADLLSSAQGLAPAATPVAAPVGTSALADLLASAQHEDGSAPVPAAQAAPTQSTPSPFTAPLFGVKSIQAPKPAPSPTNIPMPSAFNTTFDKMTLANKEGIKTEFGGVKTALTTPTPDKGFVASLKESAKNAYDDFSNNVDQWHKPDSTALDKVAATTKTGLDAVGLLFAPITAALQSVQSKNSKIGSLPIIPGVVSTRQLADGLNRMFNAIGEAGGGVATSIVDTLPISPESKEKIRGPLQQIGALLAQVATGKAGIDDLTPKMKAKLAVPIKELGGAVTDAMADPKTHEVMHQREAGLAAPVKEVPAKLFPKSADVKNLNNIKATEMPPAVREEIRDVVAKHGETAAHAALVKELGIGTRQAEAFVREAPTPQTAAEEMQAHQNALRSAVPNTDTAPDIKMGPKGKPSIDTIDAITGKVTKGKPQAEGSGTTIPSRKTSAKEPSAPVALRREPSGETISTTAEPPLNQSDKSTNQSLSSNRIKFLNEFDMAKPDEATITKYLEKVKEHESEFQQATHDIASEHSGEYVSRTKTKESILTKLERRNGAKTLGEVNDTHGSTVVVPHDKIDAAIQYAKESHGIKGVDDFREKPNFLGYRGVHLDHELSNGQRVEVQIHTKEGLAQKMYAHEIYEKWRKHIEANTKNATEEDVLKRVPQHLRDELKADIQKSRDIFAGKEPIPERIIEKRDATIQKPKPKEKSGIEPVKASGKNTKSKLGERISKAAVEKNLGDFSKDTPGYDKSNVKERAAAVHDMIKNDPERAIRIALGQETAPSDFHATDMYRVLADEAFKNGDAEIIHQLGTESTIPRQASGAGQFIQGLAGSDVLSPVKILQDIRKSWDASIAKKEGKGAIKQEVRSMKLETKKAVSKRPSWEQFIQEIQCV